VTRLCGSFSEAQPNEVVAVEGSSGYLEVVVNRDSAAKILNIVRGIEIKVETRLPNH
jgi:S-adenosylmethionine hydrolase